MVWTFRILAGLNLLLLALALFYQSPGEDPAGEGLRMGIAVVYGVALGVVLALYRIKATWLRVILLVLLALPPLVVVYGFGLWL
jgi:hypothetical protein